MIYKIRVILDTKEDVFRDIEVRDKQTLFTLYKGIMSAFSLQGEELASFYESDEGWTQGREIPLESMDESNEDNTMADYHIYEVLPEVGSRMIFVYDYLDMWTFSVEVISIEDKKAVLNYPLTVYRFGAMPLKAPKRNNDIINLDEDEPLTLDDDAEAGFDDLDIDSDIDIEDF
ncbi:IS1096 element passenger TnpR family protein [Moheibacter stercoris]